MRAKTILGKNEKKKLFFYKNRLYENKEAKTNPTIRTNHDQTGMFKSKKWNYTHHIEP